MNIIERDIFNFVFYRENLSAEKVAYLQNSKSFDEEIEFYSSLKEALEQDITEATKQKLADKIPLYVPAKIFFLKPVHENIKKRKNDVLVLAADSPKDKPTVTAKTFTDEGSHYLIRLLNFKDSAKIYVFSTTDQKLRDYKVIIQPSGRIFEQTDNSSPIEVDTSIEADKIELRFN